MSMYDEFYGSDGNLSQEGKFLLWLAKQGPTNSRGLNKFPGWGRGRKADRLPVLTWLKDNGLIVIETRYSGKTGHPPLVHEVTSKGADWVDILSRDLATKAEEEDIEYVDIDPLIERIEALEAQFEVLVSRLAALGDASTEFTRLRAV